MTPYRAAFNTCIGSLSLGTLLITASPRPVLAEAIPAGPSPDATAASPSETSPETTSPTAAPAPVTVTELDCPPGQFPSAFADVLPTDWAYTVVNRLAAVPIQCFPLPSP